jgi:hypothetical protein
LREIIPSKKFSIFMELICSIIDSDNFTIQRVANQHGWRNPNIKDDVCDIVLELEAEPIPGGSSGNTFLTKREC